MADLLELLAESKIRDWQRRVAAGEVDPANHSGLRVESWESQLFKEIIQLHLAAREVADETERDRLRAKAEGVRVQLMMTLERDRPLLAQTLQARLAAALR